MKLFKGDWRYLEIFMTLALKRAFFSGPSQAPWFSASVAPKGRDGWGTPLSHINNVPHGAFWKWWCLPGSTIFFCPEISRGNWKRTFIVISTSFGCYHFNHFNSHHSDDSSSNISGLTLLQFQCQGCFAVSDHCHLAWVWCTGHATKNKIVRVPNFWPIHMTLIIIPKPEGHV